MSVTAVALVNSLNHQMLVKQFVSRQLDVMSVKVSSVSQLVKPSAISKPVLSNNVCNVNSISQLVKSFNVTKAVFSSNANNCHL